MMHIVHLKPSHGVPILIMSDGAIERTIVQVIQWMNREEASEEDELMYMIEREEEEDRLLRHLVIHRFNIDNVWSLEYEEDDEDE